MPSVTPAEIRSLLEVSADHCVSLYMPMLRSAPEAQQNAVRLKNLIGRVEEILESRGESAARMQEILRPLERLAANSDVLRPVGDGLALFHRPGSLRDYHVPLAFDELVTVCGRFHTRPLLPLLLTEGHYHVLAISEKRVRLFAGDREGVREVELESLPGGLAEALFIDEHEHGIQFRVRDSVRLGKRALAVFGTSSGGGRTRKKELLEYFHVIDRELHPLLEQEGGPLVLMGVEYYFPIYREANTWPLLLEEGIAGHPDRLSEHEIHESAWKVVEPHFLDLSRPLSTYKRLQARRLTLTALDEILRAAHQGQVEVLFVAREVQEWGTYDREAHRITPADEPGGEELLDLAAAQTLLHGGEVCAVERQRVPDGAAIAAGLRSR